AAAMPYARRAMEVFRQRQQAYANYDAAQESGRRASRRFLEVFIGGAYDEAQTKAGSQARDPPAGIGP
ncbi:MAG: hypothetical protein ACTHNH_06975, partial [Mesorhizobium sp.]